ncbi:polysaccharide pyruvyl transferase family protein [Neptunomonas antarctica]|uniref:polysaccharide pyruvyl transferase family protein n=1 Tax=Neptunomonas antarctica TaxID=619304 RepID=UPI0006C7CFAB|nr:polysaccharide pyruvyl transferase family protein [Neptunomonas antarctica]
MSNLVKKKLLLLDFAQETNSGDDIMQRSIIELCERHLEGELSITSYFGTNEFSYAKREFRGYREDYSLDTSGGVYPTVFLKPIDGLLGRLKPTKNILRVMYVMWFCVILMLLRMGVPLIITKFLLSKSQRQAFKKYLSADIVVWNGRNFRGKGRFSEALKIFELCVNPLICMFLKKPVICVGSSVWTLNSSISRYLIRLVVRNSKLFLVREKSTLRYINECVLGGNSCKSLQYMPDLSFYSLNKVITQKELNSVSESRRVVALTLVGRREFLNDEVHLRYLKAISDLINHITHLNYKIRVIPQVTYSLEPYEQELQSIISQNVDADIEVVQSYLGTEELLNEYISADVLVASRMHSAIFASSVGTPIIAISYDSGAKWAILDDLGVDSEMILSADCVSSSALIENFNKAILLGKLNDSKNLTQQLAAQIDRVFYELKSKSWMV